MTVPAATLSKIRYRLIDIADMNPLLVDATTLNEAFTGALTRYSDDRPRELTADVVGNGTEFYPLTGTNKVLASWVDQSSQIKAIDYPAGTVAAGYTPNWLDRTFDWTFYADATLSYLRFLTVKPVSPEKVRITYTTPHTHSTALNTVPTNELDALCDLAAAYACMALATKAAASTDSLISADSTNYRDSQLRFKQQADAWIQSYKDRLGMRTDGEAAASAVADWNRTTSLGGPFLTHRNRWR